MTAPTDPPIFHITHVDNITGILREGGLWSDAQRVARRLVSVNIGHLHIKQRRLRRPVMTRNGGQLGDYVPFNFCPRSVMLFVVDRGHQDYSGGQSDIVHLVSRVSMAARLGRAWAFTDRHAELAHALYFDDLAQLGEVPWHVMSEPYWSSVREERQAEFLVHEFFSWTAVTEVACMTTTTAERVERVIHAAEYQPTVTVRPNWYY